MGAAAGLFLAYVLVLFRGGGTGESYLGINPGKVIEFSGTASEDSYRSADGTVRFKLRLEHVLSADNIRPERVRGIVLVMVKGYGNAVSAAEGNGSIGYGERIAVTGKLKISGRPGINYTSWTVPKDIIRNGFSGRIMTVRQIIRKKLEQKINLIGYPESELFRALFLGIKEELPAEMKKGFRKTGTLHILALSGLHAGIVFMLINIILFWLPHRTVRFAAASAVLFIYLFIVGFKISLVRASLMLFIGGLVYIKGRDLMPVNILSLAAICVVLIEPSNIFTLSFQLSFLAVFGMVSIGRILSVYTESFVPGFIRYPICYSLGAQLAVAPLLLYTFGEFYLIGFFVSLLSVPVITIFIWLGILFIILPAGSLVVLQRIISGFLSILYDTVNIINRNFSVIPGIVVTSKKGYIIISMAVIVISFIFLFPRKYSNNRIGAHEL